MVDGKVDKGMKGVNSGNSDTYFGIDSSNLRNVGRR